MKAIVNKNIALKHIVHRRSLKKIPCLESFQKFLYRGSTIRKVLLEQDYQNIDCIFDYLIIPSGLRNSIKFELFIMLDN